MNIIEAVIISIHYTLRMKRFYESKDEIDKFLSTLRTTVCPRCGTCGVLARHGFIKGYSGGEDKIIRGWRIYCDPDSNHGKGCGHAPSVRLAETLPGRCLSAMQLMRFILALLSGDSTYSACKKCDFLKSIRNGYRIYKRLELCQSVIRTRLFALSPPPDQGTKKAPLLITLESLKEALGIDNAVSVYQKTFQQDFLSFT
jgi:ribosomal protein S27AE